MPKARRSAAPNQVLRLVKTWLPASLVKEMDGTILKSGGAYNGRDDFIREAIADRIADERVRPAGGPAPVLLLRSSAKSDERVLPNRGGTLDAERPIAIESITSFSGRVPVLPPHSAGGMLYGLHNRDYPTLWAAHSLISMATSRGGPIPWPEFLSNLLEAAWKIGAQLATADEERASDEMKAAIGFPTNAEKRQSSEARFIEHMVGMPDREGGPIGPLFAMKLAGAGPASTGYVVAPTDKGSELLNSLAAVGLVARPPHVDQAWRAFRGHLRATLPDDYGAWLGILRTLVEMPTRQGLLRRFAAEWPGAAASTNVAGYISRGREWGLVEPKLSEGRYALTELGRREVEEATT